MPLAFCCGRNSRSPSPWRGQSRSRSRSRARSRSRSLDRVEAVNPGNTLYVTGLSTRVTDRELEDHFAKEGKVASCFLVVEPRTRISRGFAFVTMDSVEDANRCVKYLNQSVLEGRYITVEKVLLQPVFSALIYFHCIYLFDSSVFRSYSVDIASAFSQQSKMINSSMST
ncbi:unnamed protein product [Linum tenue]|uniref:RRM domain-containing protein n=1 Tax=Linum tenue TaxID=586396 RepID=A0AAV0H5V9_9ROSI|nr:unnamed protein product [Linum tenue]